MSALFFLPQGGPEAKDSFRRGVRFLEGFVGGDGQIREPAASPFVYPVYFSAAASWVVVLEEREAANLRAQAAWLRYMKERRLDASRGWKPEDPYFGGWGYFVGIPERSKDARAGPGPLESNLSSTLWGLGALRFAGVPPKDPLYGEILSFVVRCQNFPPDGEASQPAFDDGGFYLSPLDDVLNKAGSAGKDARGRTRFRSYGSQTADGLRAMLRCGLPGDHPRVLAARKWLEQRFDPAANPGEFPPSREVLRNATYYYYAWSLSHALANLGLLEVRRDGRRIPWADALADALLERQKSDGAWANPLGDSKEDDPLIATSFAASALAVCRRTISGEGPGMVFGGTPGDMKEVQGPRSKVQSPIP